MPKPLDITGMRFGRLVAIAFSGEKSNGGAYLWLARCDCGAQIKASVGSLRSGNTKSCGCLHREAASAWRAARNRTHGLTNTPTWRCWQSIITRCTNPTSKSFPDYGGRGITICERWRDSFEAFHADMGEKPPGLSIDRHPDMNGNYEPGNCRWATTQEQNQNKRDTVLLTIDGETKCLAQWSDHFGMPRRLVYSRVHGGWPIARALTTPVDLRFSRAQKAEIPPLHPDVPSLVLERHELIAERNEQ
jgi:hypothetical protein